jgi:hypothetical protein
MGPIVGFDFDECLAQAYTLAPFAIILNHLLTKSLKGPDVSDTTRVLLERSRSIFYERVAENEVKTKGTLFRPSLLKLLPKLLKLRHEGHIDRLFIYSNNGFRDIIDVADRILALTLQKAPYNVPKEHLVNDDNKLHVMTPRVSLDDPCRSVEPKEASGFREKSLEGIQACLGMNFSEDDLWFLDDSRIHAKLMSRIKERYLVMKPYVVKLSNKRLAELFIESFPVEAFIPGTKEGDVLLTQIQILLPSFQSTGRETQKTLHEKLVKALNVFSPHGGGRLIKNWKDTETAEDVKYIETSMRVVFDAGHLIPETRPNLTYREPVGGRRKRAKRQTRRK